MGASTHSMPMQYMQAYLASRDPTADLAVRCVCAGHGPTSASTSRRFRAAALECPPPLVRGRRWRPPQSGPPEETAGPRPSCRFAYAARDGPVSNPAAAAAAARAAGPMPRQVPLAAPR
eukprot:358296-Chlamydomonas_euryale.AAC.5